MKKNKVSIISIMLSLAFIIFMFSTFYFKFEYLIVTRIVAIAFGLMYLVIEIKKEYFSKNKMLYIIFSVVSLIALIVSIIVDDSSANNLLNERVFLIPVFVFILIVIMYRDLFDENKQ